MPSFNNVNIKELNQLAEITDGDFILVESQNGTNLIDFKNFVIGPNNASFYTAIRTLSSNLTSLSSYSFDNNGNILLRNNGTVTAPSIYRSGSTTGLYYPATDTIGIVINGTERTRIDSSGRVGLNVIPSYALDITSSANDAAINIVSTTNNTGIRISNGGTGGRNYRILGTSTGSGYGTGNLVVEDQAVGARVTLDSSGNVTVASGNLTVASGAIGYSTGAGGTQSQATSKATTVTLNKTTGTIITNNATLNAATVVSFTFSNSFIASTDIVYLQHSAGGTLGAYTITATPGNGSATIYIRNNSASNLSEALTIQFAIIKSVTS